MLQIIDVEYLKDYKLELQFSDGWSGTVDFKNMLSGKKYLPLKDLSLFKQYGLVNGTIEWVNGADFAPEYLYKMAKEHLSEAIS
jgi:hypothetical protein